MKENCLFLGLNYFLDDRNSSPVFFTSLLFHFMNVTLSNSHSIMYYMPEEVGSQGHKYAIAIFSRAASLLNHSCNTNTVAVVQKNVQVTVATKRIFPGEEICHIYQGHFADTPLAKRQQLMKEIYHFTCACTACTQNYPLYEDLKDDFTNEEYLSLTGEEKNAIEDQNYFKALQIMERKLQIVSDHIQEPHKLFTVDRAVFTQCLLQCYGNKPFIVKPNVK